VGIQITNKVKNEAKRIYRSVATWENVFCKSCERWMELCCNERE